MKTPNPKGRCCDNGNFGQKHDCQKSCPELETEKLVKALKSGLPFARHVSVCENHDGPKFQDLAEDWIESVEVLAKIKESK